MATFLAFAMAVSMCASVALIGTLIALEGCQSRQSKRNEGERHRQGHNHQPRR
jgi:hypothetical protein